MSLYVLALDFAPGAGESMAAPLAEALDKTLFDARARLSDPEGGPAVVAFYGEIEQAWACSGRLRANGLKPIILMPEDLETEERRFVVRSFKFGERSLTAVSRFNEPTEIPYENIDLILRTARVDETTQIKRSHELQVRAVGAVMTGGLLVATSKEKIEHVRKSNRDEFCHLYAAGHKPVVFAANSTNYQALGPGLQPSVQANFLRLLAEVRRVLPHARYNERLLNRQARARILGSGLTESQSDIAISLLARVLRGNRK